MSLYLKFVENIATFAELVENDPRPLENKMKSIERFKGRFVEFWEEFKEEVMNGGSSFFFVIDNENHLPDFLAIYDLNLVITESNTVENYEEIIAILREMKANNISFKVLSRNGGLSFIQLVPQEEIYDPYTIIPDPNYIPDDEELPLPDWLIAIYDRMDEFDDLQAVIDEVSESLAEVTIMKNETEIAANVASTQSALAVSSANLSAQHAQAAQEAVLYSINSLENFFTSNATYPVNSRVKAKSHGAWDIVLPGQGDFNHPITGQGVKVLPVLPGVFALSTFNIAQGIDQTNRLEIAVNASYGKKLLIDVNIIVSLNSKTIDGVLGAVELQNSISIIGAGGTMITNPSAAIGSYFVISPNTNNNSIIKMIDVDFYSAHITAAGNVIRSTGGSTISRLELVDLRGNQQRMTINGAIKDFCIIKNIDLTSGITETSPISPQIGVVFAAVPNCTFLLESCVVRTGTVSVEGAFQLHRLPKGARISRCKHYNLGGSDTDFMDADYFGEDSLVEQCISYKSYFEFKSGSQGIEHVRLTIKDCISYDAPKEAFSLRGPINFINCKAVNPNGPAAIAYGPVDISSATRGEALKIIGFRAVYAGNPNFRGVRVNINTPNNVKYTSVIIRDLIVEIDATYREANPSATLPPSSVSIDRGQGNVLIDGYAIIGGGAGYDITAGQTPGTPPNSMPQIHISNGIHEKNGSDGRCIQFTNVSDSSLTNLRAIGRTGFALDLVGTCQNIRMNGCDQAFTHAFETEVTGDGNVIDLFIVDGLVRIPGSVGAFPAISYGGYAVPLGTEIISMVDRKLYKRIITSSDPAIAYISLN